MKAPPPRYILAFGLLLLLGSCVPLGTAVLDEVGPRTQLELTVEGNRAYGEELTLGDTGRARVVVDLEIQTASVQESDTAGEAEWQPRYRFPLEYRAIDSTGHSVVARDVHIDWRDEAGDLTRPIRHGSLLERSREIGPAGGRLELSAVLRPFEISESGPFAVELAVRDDRRYAATAVLKAARVEHNLRDSSNRIVLGIFMLVSGWIVAVIGFVLALTGTFSTRQPVPGDIAADDADVRKHAMFCHLAALLGYVVPFGNLIGPLVLWLMYREDHPYIDEQGREALNFQLTLLVYMLLSFVLVLAVIGVVMLVFLVLFQLVMTLVAAVRTSEGEAWRYPVTVRFVA